ncbi:MAG: ATP-dependent zinc protease [Oligoflexus sp.]
MKLWDRFKFTGFSIFLACTLAAHAQGFAKEPPPETKAPVSSSSPDAGKEEQLPEVFGWVERVHFDSGNISVKAKLDTGAKTSSLDARNIRVVRQGKKRYVRFEFIDPETKKVYPMRLPRIRGVRIIRHSGNHQRRHVVELDICLGQHQRKIEVSLIDRSNFIYPLLLGRKALKDIALIDSASTFRQKPACVYAEPLKESTEVEVPEDPEKLDYQDDSEGDDESEANSQKKSESTKKEK